MPKHWLLGECTIIVIMTAQTIQIKWYTKINWYYRNSPSQYNLCTWTQKNMKRCSTTIGKYKSNTILNTIQYNLVFTNDLSRRHKTKLISFTFSSTYIYQLLNPCISSLINVREIWRSNQETNATLGIGLRIKTRKSNKNRKQHRKLKRWRARTPPKQTRKKHSWSLRVSSFRFLQDIHRITHS
jgi:hypothetical protein